MLRRFFYFLADYMQIHPIRFWTLLTVFIALLVGGVLLLIRYRKRRKSKLIKLVEAINKNKRLNTNQKKEIEKSYKRYNILIWIISLQFLFIIGILIYFPLKPKAASLQKQIIENVTLSDGPYIFGIDVSHYQGQIDWPEVRASHHPIEYIFIRSTMGKDGKDLTFMRNWNKAKEFGFIRGAYHYYRPNENSTAQFKNFASVVKLDSGDFYPVLDVEKESIFGKDNLRKGVLNWLQLAEEHYGVKPIIYSGLSFYQDVLEGYVDGYPLWIAAYSGGKQRLDGVDWKFHQFSEQVWVKGIGISVDGNDFVGSMEELQELLMP